MTNNTVTQVSLSDLIASASAASAADRNSTRAALAAALIAADLSDATAAMLAADRSGRANVRAALTAAVPAALPDLSAAMAANDRLLHLNAAAEAASGSTAAVVDWAALIGQRVATLTAAAEALATLAVRPAGMPDDVTLSAEDLSAAIDAATPVPAAVAALAGQRVRRGGQQNDVSAFVTQRVADLSAEVPSGQVRVSDMRRGQDGAPSAGAIQQALRAVLAGTREIDGVSVLAADDRTNVTGALAAVLAE